MTQFESAEIYKVNDGVKYVACLFAKKKGGWAVQWVRANKVGVL